MVQAAVSALHSLLQCYKHRLGIEILTHLSRCCLCLVCLSAQLYKCHHLQQM